ncbi:uncharacterized protein E0L32_011293 [Thyridium curvatum]|uniref:HAUS augmin-like complex subunit 3 N-terminal domain-containing protein n=1 Tax=Thyridium curvatum TaxID=1093900 RepID=A0A507BNC5_9PEZI|nr:uncharacterized protein E0L32_011293 [Thyridium curvatum]TPX19049.1 hypothetical protein E0L32_011293 [Thyridium curvatum]
MPAAANTKVEEVLEHLRTNGPHIDEESIRSALKQEDGSDFAEWISTYLTIDTVLSPDELALYNALEKSGQAEQFARDDGSSVLPVRDVDLKRAIDELNRSTEAISKHTESLRLQQDALSRLVKEQATKESRHRDLQAKQHQSSESARQKLHATIEELTQMLSVYVTELEHQSKGIGKDLQQRVETLLQSDDKLLASLQKLGWELETENPEEQKDIVRLREVCAQLIKYKVEAIRTKLDRVYLEALISSQRSRGPNIADENELSALQEELESLFAEILPVAQMSVEQQFLEPSLKSLSGKNGQSLGRSLTAVNYIHDCMDFLLEHISLLSQRLEAFQAHQAATNTLATMARRELETPVPLPSSSKESQRPANTSPTRRRKSSVHGPSTSPVRVRGMPHSRRRSSGGLNIDIPPVEQILQTLALMLPEQDNPSPSQAERKAQIEALSTALRERAAKADDVAHNVQEAFEETTSTYLGDMRKAVAKVRESLLAESTYGDVTLTDPGIDGSIEVLAQEVDKITTRLDGADKDMAKAKGPSAKREELIARWAR